ncbi:glycosyl hydrolase family 28-related protein [Reichenbachiella versicolor]|uniref:glycosyl hydrolase family 28-related protein n=1 Tax=Reichenbachiella versicolor TaxID=1821036 RepID=UPI0013A594AD|nr:glycosyl hydrolase family 28-related protein [Reichenbachiella versicolor]
MTRRTITLWLGALFILICQPYVKGQSFDENDYYKTPLNHYLLVNFKKDYKIDNDFDTDDSPLLQKAIDFVAARNGGAVYIQKGKYTFSEVRLKPGVHLQIEPGTVIKPRREGYLNRQGQHSEYSVFYIGIKGDQIYDDMSITGMGGSFTVNLSEADNHKGKAVTVFNAQNFSVSNMKVLCDGMVLSPISILASVYKGKILKVRNGVVKNVSGEGLQYWLNLVKISTGDNLYIDNVSAVGGTTLGIEPWLNVEPFLMRHVRVDNVVAKRVANESGYAGVVLNPRLSENGIIKIKDVIAKGSATAVSIEKQFLNDNLRSKGFVEGKLDPSTSIRNVKATSSEKQAMVKYKFFRYLPCDIRPDVAKPEGNKQYTAMFSGPSIAPILNIYGPKINVSKESVIESNGFPDQRIYVTRNMKYQCK